MKTEGAATPKWELTGTAFENLLAAFASDREIAGEKYVRLRNNLVRYFEVRGIFGAGSGADEVINRLARKLESGESLENINTYALGIARMLTLELRRSPGQKTSSEIPEIAIPPIEEDRQTQAPKLTCLNKCLTEIPAEKKEIIVGYYRGERREKIENRIKLAEELGIAQNALRNRAVRMRNRLESCIKKCVQKTNGS